MTAIMFFAIVLLFFAIQLSSEFSIWPFENWRINELNRRDALNENLERLRRAREFECNKISHKT